MGLAPRCAILALLTSVAAGAEEPGSGWPALAVVDAGTEHAWVSYGGRPAFGYGYSPQSVLAKIPVGEELDPEVDFRDFAPWASARGITIVRSYPPSSIVGERYLELFERAEDDPDRFDLERFNAAYFDRLREACALFREHGIFVHLQLWQAVTWKKFWDTCYYHPDLNVNPELSRQAGPGKFAIDPKRNPALVAHQREHVRRFLDATGDLGNVFYDVMNEIGNGTGANGAWLEAMLDEIEAWEERNGREVIVGLNDEGRERSKTGGSLSNPRLDVAFVDLGRYDEHVEVRARYLRPTFGVRNIDWNPETEKRAYFAGEYDLSLDPDPGRALRSKRMYWRMFLARVQMNAGYADWGRFAYRGGPLADLALEDLPSRESPHLDATYSRMVPVEILESPTEHSYGLVSPSQDYYATSKQARQAVVLVEVTPGVSGIDVPAGKLRLRGLSVLRTELKLGGTLPYRVRIEHLSTGEFTTNRADLDSDPMEIDLPAFRDALLVQFRPSFRQKTELETEDPVIVSARLEGTSVRLDWDRMLDDVAWILLDDRAVGRTRGTTFVDPNPPPGALEYRIVFRKEDELEGGIENGLSASIVVPDDPPVPCEIRPVKVWPTRIALWAKGNVAPDVNRYEWEVRAAGGDWKALATTETFYLRRDGLEPGTTAEYRVRALDAAGRASDWSEPLAVTTRNAAGPLDGLSRTFRSPKRVAAGLVAGLTLVALVTVLTRRIPAPRG